ncbi:hypothetical protein T265_10969 [Opisthorchis viverrini]|uniref:Major facilitator superfamily (MFS) profile domain-containing protein n=1 Tax=Opisthorchis viverrini TaxID=6198 RepID=A0A074Z0L9_OPIVI|nr:hypothetical protein T265_10969 [Opisthorchis viverrini]KER20503.1 hypothetical protein T265_10969 [Opisthorchis viverrini]
MCSSNQRVRCLPPNQNGVNQTCFISDWWNCDSPSSNGKLIWHLIYASMARAYLPWLILATAALSVVFLGGKRRAFGIFVAQLHAEYNQTSLAELNWIGDSYAAIGYLTTSLSTSAILARGRRFRISQLLGAVCVLLACITSAYVPNPHWLFLTHTILHGIGSSLVLSTAGLVVNEHFDKNHRYHILATTLVSGGSVASIVFVEFYAYLIESMGWRNAFVVLGVIYFFVLLTGTCVFQKDASKPDYRNDKYAFLGRTQLSFQRSCLLILWFIDRIFTSVVTYGMLLNLADYMYRRETSLSRSALLTTLFAAGEASTYVIGAVVTGLTRDLLKNRLRYILLVTSLIMGCALCAWEFWAANVALSHFLAYLCGFCLGPSITFLFPAGEELTMLPGHMAYPFSLGGMGVGMALSPVLSALIAQNFQYRWFFLVQGLLMFIKFGCILLSTMILRSLARQETNYVCADGTECVESTEDEGSVDCDSGSKKLFTWPTSMNYKRLSEDHPESPLHSSRATQSSVEPVTVPSKNIQSLISTEAGVWSHRGFHHQRISSSFQSDDQK